MTTFNPVYRMRVFAQSSETTVLTPAASAPHSDNFQVATAQGISGFQPYMGIPKGRKERFDPVNSKLDIGAITVTLLDVRTTVGGTNLRRWVSGFVGDESGKTRLIGLKAAIEESIDGGSTFLPYYIGRIRSFNLGPGLLQYTLQIKTDNDLQKLIKVFEGEPSASLFDHDNGGYANRLQVMPLGPDIRYGQPIGLNKPNGTWRFAKSIRNRAIEVDITDFNSQLGRVYASKGLLERVEVDSKEAWKKETEGRRGTVIVRVTQGATVGRFYMTYSKYVIPFKTAIAGFPASLHSMLLEPIDSSAFEHQPLTVFADGSTVSFQILFDEEPNDNLPLLLHNVHPVQFWNDLLLCKFSRLNTETGVSLFSGSIEIDQGSFDTLIADGQFKNSRWLIKESDEMSTFIEDNILKPFQLWYRMEPTASAGRFYSQTVPFSMALPRTLSGIQTITEDDLKAGSSPTWEPGKPFINFETIYYSEQLGTIQNLIDNRSEVFDAIEGPSNPTMITEFEIPLRTVDLDNVHGGGGEFKVDARGIRYFPFEFYLDLEFVNGIELSFSRKRVMERLVARLHEAASFRWSRGPATVTIIARRVSATTGLNIGDFRLLNIDFLPDPFSHTRGTARLMQCVERSEIANSPNITFRFVDSGVNIQRAAPTVDLFNLIAGTSAISGTISVLQAGRVETSFAITDTSTTVAPDATSSLWEFGDVRSFTVNSSQNVTLGELTGNGRVWVRSFIKPNSNQDFQLPSDFGFMAAPGFVDVPLVIQPPTNLRVFNLTVSGASATWDVGDTTSSIEIRMKEDDQADLLPFANLSAGANVFTWTGRSTLAVDNPHTIGVRHRDTGTGTVSAEVTVNYDIENVLVQPRSPPIRGIFVRDPVIELF